MKTSHKKLYLFIGFYILSFYAINLYASSYYLANSSIFSWLQKNYIQSDVIQHLDEIEQLEKWLLDQNTQAFVFANQELPEPPESIQKFCKQFFNPIAKAQIQDGTARIYLGCKEHIIEICFFQKGTPIPLDEAMGIQNEEDQAIAKSRGFWIHLKEKNILKNDYPFDVSELIDQLDEAFDQNPVENDAILNHKLHGTHVVRFYQIKGNNIDAQIDQLHQQAFGKIGPLLVTQKHGIVVPVIGDFYVLEKARQKEGQPVELVIKKLSDQEVEAKYGLVQLKDPTGVPYEMKWHTLNKVIGRLSILPGRFGWIEIKNGHRERPIVHLTDVLSPIICGSQLSYRNTRLEVKAAGAPKIKSIHAVHDTETHERIIIMPTRGSEPKSDMNFRLIDTNGEVILTDMKEFLNLPGIFADGYFQPGFWSAPGLEHVDQSQAVQRFQDVTRTNSVTSPDHSFYFFNFEDLSKFPQGRHAISFRMSLNDPHALRLVELLEEYKFVKNQGGNLEDTHLGQFAKEGQMYPLIRQFVYNIGYNMRGMMDSQLYMFADGVRAGVEQETTWMMHAEILRDIIVLQSQGTNNLMDADELLTNIMNNDTLDGRLADLAEYGFDMPATNQFAVKLILHLISRVVEEFKNQGLLTEEESLSADLLNAFRLGVYRKDISDEKLSDADNVPFPEPNLFSLRQEEVEPQDANQEPLHTFHIDISSRKLNAVVRKIVSEVGERTTSRVQGLSLEDTIFSLAPILRSENENMYSFNSRLFNNSIVPSKPIMAFLEAYEKHISWKQDFSDPLSAELEYIHFKDTLEKVWKIYFPESEEPLALNTKELLLHILKAIIKQDYFIDDTHEHTLPEAIELLNENIKKLRDPEYWMNISNLTEILEIEIPKAHKEETKAEFLPHFPKTHYEEIKNKYLSAYQILKNWNTLFPDIEPDKSILEIICNDVFRVSFGRQDRNREFQGIENNIDDHSIVILKKILSHELSSIIVQKPLEEDTDYVIVSLNSGKAYGVNIKGFYTGSMLNNHSVILPKDDLHNKGFTQNGLFIIMPKETYIQKTGPITETVTLDELTIHLTESAFISCIEEIRRVLESQDKTKAGYFMTRFHVKGLYYNVAEMFSAFSRLFSRRINDLKYMQIGYLLDVANNSDIFRHFITTIHELITDHPQTELSELEKSVETLGKSTSFQEKFLNMLFPFLLKELIIWGDFEILNTDSQKVTMQFKLAFFDKNMSPEDIAQIPIDINIIYQGTPVSIQGQNVRLVGRDHDGNYIVQAELRRKHLKEKLEGYKTPWTTFTNVTIDQIEFYLSIYGYNFQDYRANHFATFPPEELIWAGHAHPEAGQKHTTNTSLIPIEFSLATHNKNIPPHEVIQQMGLQVIAHCWWYEDGVLYEKDIPVQNLNTLRKDYDQNYILAGQFNAPVINKDFSFTLKTIDKQGQEIWLENYSLGDIHVYVNQPIEYKNTMSIAA